MIIFDGSAAFELFPDFEVTFLLAPAPPPAAADDAPERIAARLAKEYGDGGALSSHPLADAYRQFHLAMNVRPSGASTPLKQASRVLAKGYRAIHPAVDVCMEIEYATLCSFQVYDRQRLGERVHYLRGSGTETVEREMGKPGRRLRNGELALADELGVINSPTWGNAPSRMVRPDTAHVLVRIAKIPGLAVGRYIDGVDEAAERLGATHLARLNDAHRVQSVSI